MAEEKTQAFEEMKVKREKKIEIVLMVTVCRELSVHLWHGCE